MPQTPYLFAPADDRNAPATPTAGWRRQLPAVQFNRSHMAQHVGCHLKADARSISLASPETANGAPLSETKVKADVGLALQCPQRPQIHPRAFGNLHLSPSAAN